MQTIQTTTATIDAGLIQDPAQLDLLARFDASKAANKMTVKNAMAILRALGMVLTRDMDSREYRVNFKGGREATAYYAVDLDDAIGTAQHMATQRAA